MSTYRKREARQGWLDKESHKDGAKDEDGLAEQWSPDHYYAAAQGASTENPRDYWIYCTQSSGQPVQQNTKWAERKET